MKSFDLEKALAGEPVRLRDGRKAMFVYRTPEGIEFTDSKENIYPVLGIIYDDFGRVVHRSWWTVDGRYESGNYDNRLDAVGMWEETLESTIRKAYKESLPLRTRKGDKVYIVQISDSDNPLVKDQPVFGVMSAVASHRWGIQGNYLNNAEPTPHDIVGLWEEEVGS